MLSTLFYSLTPYTLSLHLTDVYFMYNTPRRTAPAISHLPIRTAPVLTYASRHPWSPSHNSTITTTDDVRLTTRTNFEIGLTLSRKCFLRKSTSAHILPPFPSKSTNNYGGALPFWFWHDLTTRIFLGVGGHGDTLTKYPREVESSGCGYELYHSLFQLWICPTSGKHICFSMRKGACWHPDKIPYNSRKPRMW